MTRTNAPELHRKRLLDVVRGRFDHRLIAVVAGAGFGKSTLLRQTMAENLAEPRGIDACIECTPDDAHLGHFAARLGALFDVDAIQSSDPTATAQAVAGAIALRSPIDLCLLIEDAHHLRSTPAWEVVRRIHDRLPPNGHLLLSTRTDPDLPFARFAARGEALLIDEKQLAFTTEECVAFGVARGVDLSTSAIEWPALAELEARGAGPKLRRSYLVEEVVGTLDPTVRHLLGAVVVAEGADNSIASALVGRPVDVGDELRNVPLVHVDDAGWVQPHDLWRQAIGDLLTPEQRRVAETVAATELAARGHYAQAMRLHRAAGNWAAAGRVALGALSMQPPAVDTSLLSELLNDVPVVDRAHPGWQLAGALVTYERSISSARPGLVNLADVLEESELISPIERADAFVAVIVHLLTIGRRMGDEELMHWCVARLGPLAALRHPAALALRADTQAVVAQIHGRCAEGLTALDEVDLGSISAELAAHILMASGNLHLLDDRPGRAEARFREASVRARGPVRLLADELTATAVFALGRLDEAIDMERRCLDAAERLGLTSRASQFRAMLAAMLAVAGRTTEAATVFEQLSVEQGSRSADDETRSLSLFVLAILALERGERSTAIGFVERIPTPDGHLQRALFLPAATIVALLPERRTAWAAIPARLIQRTVLLGLQIAPDPIDGAPSPAPLRDLDPALVPLVLQRCERTTPKHPDVDDSASIRLSLLGPVEISPLADPAPWRRARVRELVAAIALSGPRPREYFAEALWPEQAQGVGSRNLRVNLSYLADAIDPDRQRGGPSSLISAQGTTLAIAAHVRVDIASFDDARRRARAAELDNDPAAALLALTEALALWRGDVAADIEAEWLDGVREQRRSQFVAMAVRAGELALGQGDVDQAVVLAERVLTRDSSHERAGRLRSACLLAGGDRRAAAAAIRSCLDACDEAGVDAESETIILATRLGVL